MESAMKSSYGPGWFAPHANIRTDSYVLLASLLGQPPTQDLLNILQNLQWDGETILEKLDDALMALRQASHDYPLAAMEEEFNRLFVGLGSGEIVPYASWYREKRLHSAPLASLRSDLIRLGIVRKTESHEPEDHAGVLCEIMALITRKPDDAPLATQARFFQQHVASWMTAFFKDLQSAKNARFYRIVGLFGGCFLESEIEFLEFNEKAQFSTIEGGVEDEIKAFGQPADIP